MSGRESYTPVGRESVTPVGREADTPGRESDPPGVRESVTPVAAAARGGPVEKAWRGTPGASRFTPVRESVPPVRERLTRGGGSRGAGACASRLPRLARVVYPGGQVVRRRYSWGSFCGSVRTSSTTTKLASEYMWGR